MKSMSTITPIKDHPLPNDLLVVDWFLSPLLARRGSSGGAHQVALYGFSTLLVPGSWQNFFDALADSLLVVEPWRTA